MLDERQLVGGPVSGALEADVRAFVRKHGIVVWLDADSHYTSLVERLASARAAGQLPYEVRGFRGSHLELMLSLEGLTGGTEKRALVVHLPGFHEESVVETPWLQLRRAGVRYQKALDTAVSEAAAGRVRLEQIAAFQQNAERSLERADAWLAAMLEHREDGLGAQLRAMKATAVLDDLLSGGLIAEHVRAENPDPLWHQLGVWTGLDFKWRDVALPSGKSGPDDLAFAAASWALCVEYVDDLRRAPVSPLLSRARELPRGVIDECRSIASHLRERHAGFYERTASETEQLLEDEVLVAQAADLGKIDTFRFEEEKVLEAALDALEAERWDVAAEWAAQRVDGGSFWVSAYAARESAWRLVADAASLGQAITSAGSLGAKTLDAAVECYVARGAAVDAAHRHLEQRRVALLYTQVPEFEKIRARLDRMRQIWRAWADGWARDFNAACKEHGFLPEPSLQQRTLFDEVVRPLAQDGATAFFVVDALRFEMGRELHRAFADTPAATVELKARLAELPTNTEVGMNVLAPVMANGRLRPAITDGRVQGFSTGEFRVSNPETRKRAMQDRVGGATCPWLSLEEVVSRDSASLKRTVAQAKLLVVHSEEIDKAGERGVGPAVFELVLQKLRAAWHLLRDAGVRRFVFTADHGFLLLDDNMRVTQSHGRKIDPKRRHVFSPIAADHAGEVRVAASDLGYEGVSEHLIFPETTAVFDVGERSLSFVHGGNSLEERVIPVITIVHRAAVGGTTLQYAITATAQEPVGGMHALEVRVDVVAQHALDFGSSRDVELAMRVTELPDVQVELCQTRGKGARLASGGIVARVGESFELFFRLAGSTDARVLVQLYHPSATLDVASCEPDARFAVTPVMAPTQRAPTPAVSAEWLAKLPEGGVRQVFAHLAAHGTVTEPEAVAMLGSPRAFRRFRLQLEELAGRAPFAIRIDVVAGVNRLVREGSGS